MVFTCCAGRLATRPFWPPSKAPQPVHRQGHAHHRPHQGGRVAEPAGADAVLRPVDRRHRRAAVYRQVRRLSSRHNKGFRTIGEIQQDLDLFRMPSTCASRPTARPRTRRSTWWARTRSTLWTPSAGRAASASTQRLVSSPRLIYLSASPSSRASKCGAGRPDRRAGAIPEGAEANPQSSLASYRIGELLFTQRNFQASVNSYRDSLRGDGEPRWTEVWSHIALGKIFDITVSATAPSASTARRPDQRQHPGRRERSPPVAAKPYKLPDTSSHRHLRWTSFSASQREA